MAIIISILINLAMGVEIIMIATMFLGMTTRMIVKSTLGVEDEIITMIIMNLSMMTMLIILTATNTILHLQIRTTILTRMVVRIALEFFRSLIQNN